MRLAYVLLADAANRTADGKVNALGIGIRQVQPATLPSVFTGVLMAGAEATKAEFGQHHVRLSLLAPGAKRATTIVEGTLDVADRPGIDERLPLSLDVQLRLAGLLLEQPGVYKLRIQIGTARGDYSFAVSARAGADEKTTD